MTLKTRLLRSSSRPFATRAVALIGVLAVALSFPRAFSEFAVPSLPLAWERADEGLASPGFQQMTAVALTPTGALVGVGYGDRGLVWSSLDGGRSWHRRDNHLAAPISTAFWGVTAHRSGRVVAVGQDSSQQAEFGADAAIWLSDDDGVTWTRVFSASLLLPAAQYLYGITESASGMLIAVGHDYAAPTGRALVFTSPDGGVTWTRQENLGGGGFTCSSFMYGVTSTSSGRVVAFGSCGPPGGIWTSDDDGVTWTLQKNGLEVDESTENMQGILGVTETLGKRLIAIGTMKSESIGAFTLMVWTSDDGGDSWTRRRSTLTPFGRYEWIFGVAHSNGVTVAVGETARSPNNGDAAVLVSNDEGVSWTMIDVPFELAHEQFLNGIGVNREGAFVAVGVSYEEESTSHDGAVWISSVPTPDLQVSALSNPPAFAPPGGRFTVSHTTTNQGSGMADPSRTRFFLSQDDQKSQTDTQLTPTHYMPEVLPGGSSTDALLVRVPDAVVPGLYWLLACADAVAEVPELDENNNCLVADTQITIAKPDLQQQAVGTAAVYALPGDKITVEDTVQNISAVTAAATTTRFYFSFDTNKNAGDVLLTGKRALPELLAGANSVGSTTVTVPLSIPHASYRLLACADDLSKLKESDEANNCTSTSTVILVGRPDLVVTAVNNPPATIGAGGKFTTGDAVLNQGTVPANGFSVSYYLSTDIVRSGGDIVLTGKRALPGLASGETLTGTRRVTIPVSALSGSYYVIACADEANKVPEGNEANNCRASAAQVLITP